MLRRRQIEEVHHGIRDCRRSLGSGSGDCLIYLGGGFKHFLFSCLFGEMIQFNLINIFQMG